MLTSLKRVLANLRLVSSSRDARQKEPWVLRRSGQLITLAIILTVAGAYISIFQLPKLADADLKGQETSATEMAEIKNGYRELGLRLTTGLAAAFAAALTWGRLELSRQRHQNEISGQITERYTRAVDQLGNEDPAVRLGGLFALERIALDSDRDRRTVCEVVSAFIRYRRSPEVLDRVNAAGTEADEDDDVEAGLEQIPRPLEVDVSTALSILRKGTDFWQVSINLSGTDLRGTDLLAVDLTRANLSRANLSRANLGEAKLGEADLRGTDLSRAVLTGALLTDADLIGAHLTGAVLAGANLREANLAEANLSRASLREANLWKAKLIAADLRRTYLPVANLIGADLRGADASGTTLRGAKLMEADLSSGANLSRANLTGANLSRANLTDANLGRASLTDADLTGADLTGAILTGADLTGADLTGAILTNVSLTPSQRTQAEALADEPSTDGDSMDDP